MTEHTPGPWHAWAKDGWHVSDGADRIADLAELDDQCFGYDEAIELEEANAHLIAAAPELLEACQALVKMIDYAVEAGMNGSISNQCITTDRARAAIAKATVTDEP